MANVSPTFASGMEGASNYNQWVVSLFKSYIGAAVMEVGIGHGSFYRLLSPLVKTYVGIDIDSDLVEQAKRKNPGAHYLVADVTSNDLRKRVAGSAIDTVVCWNVLEHIADDHAAVTQLLSILPSRGHLLLYVPALPALYTALDRLAGHHRRYTRRSLAALIPESESEIVQLCYVNPIGGLGWWLNGLNAHQSLDSDGVNRQIAFFDKYVLPASRLFTPLCQHVFGQSLVCAVKHR